MRSTPGNTAVKVKQIIPHVVVISLFLLALSPAWSAAKRMESNAQHGNTVVKKDEDLPGKGMTMRKVENKYGKPSTILEATGKPPITRWVYKEFTVYFEGPYVIHAVINHPVEPLDEDNAAQDITGNTKPGKPMSAK